MATQQPTYSPQIVLSAYTGVLLCDVTLVHAYIEIVLGRPVLTHELQEEEIWVRIRQAVKDRGDFDRAVAALAHMFPTDDATPDFRGALADVIDYADDHVGREGEEGALTGYVGDVARAAVAHARKLLMDHAGPRVEGQQQVIRGNGSLS